MKNETIELTNKQWKELVNEKYLEDINGNEIKIEVVQENYDDTKRHTECHHMIFKRLFDEKYFRINYETSVKDSMEWDDCNYGSTKAIQVFPKQIITTIFTENE